MAAFSSARRPVPLARGKAWLTALAAAALLLRLLLPASPMPNSAMVSGAVGLDPVLAELLAGGGICHGDPDAPAKGMPAPGSAACLLCPLCAVPMPLLAVPAFLPAPAEAMLAGAVLWPPATAPPPAMFRPANPRAPPTFSA